MTQTLSFFRFILPPASYPLPSSTLSFFVIIGRDSQQSLFSIFRCVFASLNEGVSVRPSVCPSVSPSVTHKLNSREFNRNSSVIQKTIRRQNARTPERICCLNSDRHVFTPSILFSFDCLLWTFLLSALTIFGLHLAGKTSIIFLLCTSVASHLISPDSLRKFASSSSSSSPSSSSSQF